MSEKCPSCGVPHCAAHANGVYARESEIAICRLRSKLSASESEVARLEALFQRTQGVGVHHSWVAKAQRLEEENARLRQEVEDVRALDEWLHESPGTRMLKHIPTNEDHCIDLLDLDNGSLGSVGFKRGADASAARRAAVEYLAKEGK